MKSQDSQNSNKVPPREDTGANTVSQTTNKGHPRHHAHVHRKGVNPNEGTRDNAGPNQTQNKATLAKQPSHLAFNVPASLLTSNSTEQTQSAALLAPQREKSFDQLKRSRTVSSGSEYAASEADYVDRELEKLIYTYGPYTPNKIDNRQVPRPVTHVDSNDVQPTEAPVLTPNYTEETTVKTGVCSKRYLSLTLDEVPLYGETLNRIKIPLAAVVQPFAEELDNKIPIVDLLSEIGETDPLRQNLIRCPRCQAYFNPAMEGDSRLDYRICNFCYTGFTLTDLELMALNNLKAQVAEGSDVAPIMNGSIDFVAPARYFMPKYEQLQKKPSQIASLISRASELSSKISMLSIGSTPKEEVVYSTYSVTEPTSTNPFPYEQSVNALTAGDSDAEEENTGSIVAPLTTVTTPRASTQGDWNDGITVETRTPGYVIAVDVTSTSNALKLKECVLSCLKETFEECKAKRKPVKFCVLTFDCVVYLYDRHHDNIFVNVVSEVADAFSPSCVSELFVEFTGDNLDEVMKYLDNISRFTTPPTGSLSCGNFALSVGISLLADANMPGTVSIFYAQPPEVGLGHCPKPQLTSDFSLDESMKIAYDGMIKLCYEHAIAVDIYICATQERLPADVPMQYISQQTAGLACYFSCFNAVAYAEKITKNLVRLFVVPHGYNCELKLRVSKAIDVQESYCPFHNARSYIDRATMRVPRLSPDSAICFLLSMDDVVTDRRELYVQLACMYNSSVDGRKLVRIHTQSMKISTNVHSIFKSACCDTLVNYYARKLVYNMIRSGKDCKKAILDEVVGALASYRKLCAPSTPDNQLILPDNLKYLPCALNSLFKIVNAGEQGIEFLQKMLRTLLAPIQETMYVYSRCYCLHRSVHDPNVTAPEEGWQFTCKPVSSTITKVYSDGIYIIDDGYKIVLYFGPHVRWALLQELFGEDLLLDEKTSDRLRILDSTPTARSLLAAIERVRACHIGGQYLGLKILPYSSRHHRLLKLLLLEDESGGELSYVNFLVHIHKLIRQSVDDVVG
ncbi:Protein transport protein Sec24C [Babesia sp. Xinjiang]|uniref:Protein transport protein Sec24C n=1 Tax=Babesia sp. Xinjiang TaxID=462227 RepID=UPI000A22FF90|nr:Protein transport protein Sec24C [Babesia sp. Xinjiang]ORM39731.1 Protein transport protein Sec24C [Babesia sp. Xinjiang]